MRRLEKLPPAFKRFEKMGGVLNFAVFGDTTGTEEDIVSAISCALGLAGAADVERLRSSGCRPIRKRAFFGDWYDIETGHLLKLGTWRTSDGTELQNPKLAKLDVVRIISGGSHCPEAGAGGQFAYAFSNPPYSLKARPSEVQAVFEEICDFILVPSRECEILDWSSPQLPDVSDYFAAGMEWWGVFLFSIYLPEVQRLTIVAGSTTD